VLEQRFMSKVDTAGEGGCWLWTASVIGGPRGGYGQYRVGKKMRKAHVVAWEALVGPVPDGMQLDHLCRNRACVNPAHLDPVPMQENLRRSPLTPQGKTVCLRGHSLEDAYLYGGKRHCRTCRTERDRTEAAKTRHREYMVGWMRKQRAQSR
jgi:hypothetical protein